MTKSVLSPLDVSTSLLKKDAASALTEALATLGLRVRKFDLVKPWGLECKIDERDAAIFLDSFFIKDDLSEAVMARPFGPKILIIEGGKRLSWHVHERKDAFLRILSGHALVYTSATDEEMMPGVVTEGGSVHIPELVRHRLGGIGAGTVVAEISRNVYPDRPSDDEDERRISDDFGRT